VRVCEKWGGFRDLPRWVWGFASPGPLEKASHIESVKKEKKRKDNGL
jgi:hypothetical protein